MSPLGVPNNNPVNAFLEPKKVTPIVTQKPQQAPIQQLPVQQPKPLTLFSDEQEMIKNMKLDNLSDDEATKLIKMRRTDLL